MGDDVADTGMQVVTGTRLGPYEIVSPIGAGGMGEVYRARDTRLDRSVAIKILPAELAHNAQFKLRFEREARSISSLNHPNICQLYDVGQQDGTDYLVMELLEGETLAERLTKGPVPLTQALKIGIEIATALDKAHRQGIVHRDLKPSNVMLIKEGAKLLDFGLAKGQQPAVGTGSNLATAQQLTAEGTILGTFQYMPPEQLEGAEADSRSDIWAFGAVLYEMITGRRAFEGKTRGSLIAAIVEKDPPPVSQIQPLTPPSLEHVIRKCLAKDADDRWQSAHDLADELRWISETRISGEATALPKIRLRRREALLLSLALVAGLAAITFAALWQRGSSADRPVIRSTILPPESFDFAPGLGALVLSPDGSKIAFVAHNAAGNRLLFLRRLDAGSAKALEGTEGAENPFWSPDSRYLGFFAGGKLKKIDASGGPAQTLCNAATPRGGSWSRSGIIVFNRDFREGLYTISAADGSPAVLTHLDPGRREISHRWPWLLPDQEHVLFLVQRAEGGAAQDDSTIEMVSLKSKKRTTLMRANSSEAYADGHLLFWRDKSVMAQPFNTERLALEGDPVPIAENVQYTAREQGVFSVSGNGLLAFQSGASSEDSQLVWFDRTGKQLDVIGKPAVYGNPALSHDQKSLAFSMVQQTEDLWIFDLQRRTARRFTFDSVDENSPVWSPDDRRIAYNKNEKNAGGIYLKSLSGSSVGERLYVKNETARPTDWSRDGRRLLFEVSGDVGILSMPQRQPTMLTDLPFRVFDSCFSPDGKWVVHSTQESGRSEVYIQTASLSGEKWQISTEGGDWPRWSGDGREIVYVAPGGMLTAVKVGLVNGEFLAGTPQRLFSVHMKETFARGTPYDLSADGQRFIVNTYVRPETTPVITLVQNWTESMIK